MLNSSTSTPLQKLINERAERYARYLVGKGIDIGAGATPVRPDCFIWDVEQGDAQRMDGLDPESFDWVFSSHAIEHMRNVHEALHNWWKLVKPGGYLIVVGPDEDLYEQHCWPSLFNDDHKFTFSIDKWQSWSPVSLNYFDLIKNLPNHKVICLETLDTGYKYGQEGIEDQTQMGVDASIGCVIQKIPIDTKRLSSLSAPIICPNCNGDLILTGEITKGTHCFQVRCSRCNFVGKMQL